MEKLFCDCKTDAEKSAFFLSGRAVETGVIAAAISNDVAMAYHRCSEFKKEINALRAKVAEMERQEPVAWLHETRRDSDVVTSAVKQVWGKAVVGALAAYSIPLYLAPGAQPAPMAVAYLDLGAGGYMDIGTDLTDEALAALPKGRHLLGIVGTYGVEGYIQAQPAPSVPMDVIADYLVSISAHLARRDDAKAQAEIGELLKMIAAAPKMGNDDAC